MCLLSEKQRWTACQECLPSLPASKVHCMIARCCYRNWSEQHCNCGTLTMCVKTGLHLLLLKMKRKQSNSYLWEQPVSVWTLSYPFWCVSKAHLPTVSHGLLCPPPTWALLNSLTFAAPVRHSGDHGKRLFVIKSSSYYDDRFLKLLVSWNSLNSKIWGRGDIPI